jgi:ABC-2 type transport system ATP-binding protein
MLQRIGLAQAIVHEPDLIFLDEPTSGLDPIGRRTVRDILRAQRDRGATVFLNSHLLGEIEVTCDRVVFIKDGEVVASHDLADRSNDEIRLLVRAGNVSPAVVDALRQFCTDITVETDGLLLTAPFKQVIPEIVRALTTQGADVYEVTPQREPLEELFVRIMGKDSGL